MIGGLEVEGQAGTTVGVGATEVVVEGATLNLTEEEVSLLTDWFIFYLLGSSILIIRSHKRGCGKQSPSDQNMATLFALSTEISEKKKSNQSLLIL